MKASSFPHYWEKDECIVFYSSKQPYFELSNMYHGMPIKIGDYVFNSSEALYQACKYPKDLKILPKKSKTTIANVRERILKAKTPMQAKMTQKCAKNYVRKDWDEIKVAVMLAALVMKAYQHERFREVLLSTSDKPIVEQSRKDMFWGAIDKGDKLYGNNMLGKLLVMLRDDLDFYLKNKTKFEEYLLHLLDE